MDRFTLVLRVQILGQTGNYVIEDYLGGEAWPPAQVTTHLHCKNRENADWFSGVGTGDIEGKSKSVGSSIWGCCGEELCNIPM